MDNYGTDFKGSVKIESVSTKPSWTSADERRLIYCEDTGDSWIGGAADWEGLEGPQGNQGAAGAQGNQGSAGSQGNQGNQGAGATASGNTGNVQFNSSGSFGSSDSLQWDNTNKNLGVGKSPGCRLDIQGDTLLLTSETTGAGAHSLPQLVLMCRDNSTRDGAGGFIRYRTYNSADEVIEGIQLNGGLEDATDGTEQGCLDVAMYRDGAVKIISFNSVLDGFVPGDNNYWNLGGNSNNWATVYAITYVDNTPAFEGDALGEIAKIKTKGGEIDHSTLPVFAQKREMKPLFEERVVKRLAEVLEKKRKLVPIERIEKKGGKDIIVIDVEEKEVIETVFEELDVYDKNGLAVLNDQGVPIKKRRPVTQDTSYTKRVKVGESSEEFIGRDLGAMISVLTKGVQQLIERVEALEKKI